MPEHPHSVPFTYNYFLFAVDDKLGSFPISPDKHRKIRRHMRYSNHYVCIPWKSVISPNSCFAIDLHWLVMPSLHCTNLTCSRCQDGKIDDTTWYAPSKSAVLETSTSRKGVSSSSWFICWSGETLSSRWCWTLDVSGGIVILRLKKKRTTLFWTWDQSFDPKHEDCAGMRCNVSIVKLKQITFLIYLPWIKCAIRYSYPVHQHSNRHLRAECKDTSRHFHCSK